jgi:hypothetical protein
MNQVLMNSLTPAKLKIGNPLNSLAAPVAYVTMKFTIFPGNEIL